MLFFLRILIGWISESLFIMILMIQKYFSECKNRKRACISTVPYIMTEITLSSSLTMVFLGCLRPTSKKKLRGAMNEAKKGLKDKLLVIQQLATFVCVDCLSGQRNYVEVCSIQYRGGYRNERQLKRSPRLLRSELCVDHKITNKKINNCSGRGGVSAFHCFQQAVSWYSYVPRSQPLLFFSQSDIHPHEKEPREAAKHTKLRNINTLANLSNKQEAEPGEAARTNRELLFRHLRPPTWYTKFCNPRTRPESWSSWNSVMFERFRLNNLTRTFRLRGGGPELARDKKTPQRQQCVTVLFLDDITHTFRIEVTPNPYDLKFHLHNLVYSYVYIYIRA